MTENDVMEHDGAEHDAAERRRSRNLLITFVVLALIIAGAIVFGIVQLGTGSDSPDGGSGGTSETDGPGGSGDDGDEDSDDEGADEDVEIHTRQVLPEAMNGQEAIDALGDKIDAVAKRNGKTVEELKELLLRDQSAHITPDGSIVYRDSFEN